MTIKSSSPHHHHHQHHHIIISQHSSIINHHRSSSNSHHHMLPLFGVCHQHYLRRRHMSSSLTPSVAILGFAISTHEAADSRSLLRLRAIQPTVQCARGGSDGGRREKLVLLRRPRSGLTALDTASRARRVLALFTRGDALVAGSDNPLGLNGNFIKFQICGVWGSIFWPRDRKI